jgi:uracil-DNA glycosylase
MKVRVSLPVHSSWADVFAPIQGEIDTVLTRLQGVNTAPAHEMIFRAFESDLESLKCVLVGQDPYPTPGNAMGLAFSVSPIVQKIPPSLKNIFLELNTDLGIPIPKNGDLSSWSKEGVLLLNRILSTKVGESGSHADIGWKKITNHIASELGKRDLVAVLWGRHALELAPLFRLKVEGVHPSPLSAYKGFFGSRPFSRVNEILIAEGKKPVDWSL